MYTGKVHTCFCFRALLYRTRFKLAGSNRDVYEVTGNTWLWMFGRCKPRLGGLTIEETSDRQDSVRKASDKRRKETRDGNKDRTSMAARARAATVPVTHDILCHIASTISYVRYTDN
jgi:hypothetical protein